MRLRLSPQSNDLRAHMAWEESPASMRLRLSPQSNCQVCGDGSPHGGHASMRLRLSPQSNRLDLIKIALDSEGFNEAAAFAAEQHQVLDRLTRQLIDASMRLRLSPQPH